MTLKSPKSPKSPKAPKTPKNGRNGLNGKIKEQDHGEVIEQEVYLNDFGDGAGHYSDDCQE